MARRSSAAPPADPYGILLKPIPEKLVVLTFDDACRSHATFVGPLLKKLGFGATFYVAEFGNSFADKTMYMTWEQIKQLETMGFEIGNHTVGHGQFSATGLKGCNRGVTLLEEHCREHHVARPTTFCWPFYSVNNQFIRVLAERGYLFARGGGERPYLPTRDCPFDAPSFTIHDASLRKPDSFTQAARQAAGGNIVIFTFHGVPDVEHPAVGVEPELFADLMQFLKEHRFTCVAMRDLAEYVDTAEAAQLLSFPRILPWGGRSPAWGGVTQKDNRLYLCVDKMPADRKLTLPNLTTVINKAYFLADAKQRQLTIGTNDIGIHTIDVSGASSAVLDAPAHGHCGRTTRRPGRHGAGLYLSRSAASQDLGKHDSRERPIGNRSDQTGPHLPHRQFPGNGRTSVRVGADFTSPQNYVMTAPDGSTRTFVVTVSPLQGAVGVSNPSFEQFDALSDYDATVGKNPGAATWTFHQQKLGDEVGITHIAGPITAPPRPTVHPTRPSSAAPAMQSRSRLPSTRAATRSALTW